jgi:hypothetical protein
MEEFNDTSVKFIVDHDVGNLQVTATKNEFKKKVALCKSKSQEITILENVTYNGPSYDEQILRSNSLDNNIIVKTTNNGKITKSVISKKSTMRFIENESIHKNKKIENESIHKNKKIENESIQKNKKIENESIQKNKKSDDFIVDGHKTDDGKIKKISRIKNFFNISN